MYLMEVIKKMYCIKIGFNKSPSLDNPNYFVDIFSESIPSYISLYLNLTIKFVYTYTYELCTQIPMNINKIIYNDVSSDDVTSKCSVNLKRS